MNRSEPIRFRAEGDELVRRKRYYRSLEKLSDETLKVRASDDYRALFLLGWRYAWQGNKSQMLDTLAKIERRTVASDQDIVKTTRNLWIAIVERSPRRAWRLMKKLEHALSKQMRHERLRLTIALLSLKYRFAAYLPFVVLAVGMIFAVVVGGWIATAIIIMVLASYLIAAGYAIVHKGGSPGVGPAP